MRAVLRVVGVHVLLAGLALGAVAVWGTGADPARADLAVTVPDTDPRLPVNPELVALVRPPGLVVMDTTKEKNGAWLTAVLPEKEARYFTDAGVASVKALVSRDGEFSQGVWQFPVRDGADPVAALRAADDFYAAGGWAEAPGPRDVLVRSHAPTPELPLAAYRAHYVRGPYLIRVEAYGPDAERVHREFEALVDRQLDRWPPT
ncbi:hypothetical protein [Actinophytocola algeriensis]|uniref:Uncharacterized protein n=1 Tax=Actinophytocola algeriensis TaxID=1768010 RepID=A0A7W7Q4H6_9PSEU|nr:hypothetical protein [Actinophytocola algeriensis]MBB4906789.1 hypothetical protein [Actinophytocola algeriensis]MBE1478270.1 hypothetical protein [Actinophytocola algeriensis]